MNLVNRTEAQEANLSEIEKLLKHGVLGFYNSVEITEIFAFLPDRTIANVFTIMVAEDRESIDYDKECYLAERPFSIKGLKSWSFGIKRYIRHKDEIIDSLNRLSEDELWEGSSLFEPLKTPQLEYCPKRFLITIINQPAELYFELKKT